MFHTYVTASSGRQIDIDRARYLMDDAILAHVEQEWRHMFVLMQKRPRTRSTHPEVRVFDPLDAIRRGLLEVPTRAQFVWEEYAKRHADQFGQPFAPDVDPDWDA